MQQAITYLEKVWIEYSEYKEYLKSVVKPIDELRKITAEKITEKTTEEQVVEMYLEGVQTQFLHQTDFLNQQQRLFYTVEAYKDVIEIPEQITEEVKGFKFNQIFAVKNNKVEVIDNQAFNFTKEQIKNEMAQGVAKFREVYL